MSDTYVTKQGDMWDGISKTVYGTEAGMTKLLQANESERYTVIFPAGVVLTIPDYEPPKVDRLPPWRR